MYTSSKRQITQQGERVGVETTTELAHIRDIDIHIDREDEHLNDELLYDDDSDGNCTMRDTVHVSSSELIATPFRTSSM